MAVVVGAVGAVAAGAGAVLGAEPPDDEVAVVVVGAALEPVPLAERR